ncbi:MAG TPA: sugar phosphate isomerase/epimerase family protein [Chloroflexota bacterium]|nr:sugar phosphate isomerase/epimerase family protein [Chloroflexota bacterium]
MKKGVYLGCFPADLSVEECFEMAGDAGFDGVELRVDEALIENPGRVRELRSLAERGLPIHSVMAAAGRRPSITANEPEERARALELLRGTLRVAAELGAGAALVVPGAVNDQVSYDNAYTRAQTALDELARAAEETGVTACIENVWNKFLLSPLEMRRLVDEIDHPRIKVYFDVGNVLAWGYPEQWIEILGKRIERVHLTDFRTQVGNITGFVPLLAGDVNWPAVVSALQRTGYDSYLTAEVAPYRHLARKGIFDLASSIEAIIGLGLT